MTVAVAYKYAANPQDANVRSDGSVDWSRAKAAVSDYDPVAVEVGRKLAEAAGAELVGISVGGKNLSSSMAKKNAMSKGLDRGLILSDEATTSWNSAKIASALDELAKQAEAEVVLTGDSSIDEGVGVMSALVAGYLGWPCFQEVVSITPADGGYEIVQAVGGGTRTLTVSGNVVVSVATDAAPVKVPSMKDILAAGKKPVEVVAADAVSAAPVEVEVTGTEKPAAKDRKNQVYTGEEAVAELVGALRSEGVL